MIEEKIKKSSKFYKMMDTFIYYDINDMITNIKVDRSFPNKLSNIINSHKEVNKELVNFHSILEVLLMTGHVLIDKKDGIYNITHKSTDTSILIDIDLNKNNEIEVFKITKEIVRNLVEKKIKKNILNYFFKPKFVIYMNDRETLIKQLKEIEKNSFNKRLEDIKTLQKLKDNSVEKS